MNPSKPSSSTLPLLPFARVSHRVLFGSVLAGLGVALPVSLLIYPFVPQPTATQVAANAALLASTPIWLLALKSLVIFPLLEECFYRGLILQLFRRYLPLWLALLPPSLLFGVTHLGFSVQNAVFALVVGGLFSWLAIRHRSLWPAILCHTAVNFGVVFIVRPAFKALAVDHTPALLQPVVLAFYVGALAAVAGGAWLLIREQRQPAVAFA